MPGMVGRVFGKQDLLVFDLDDTLFTFEKAYFSAAESCAIFATQGTGFDCSCFSHHFRDIWEILRREHLSIATSPRDLSELAGIYEEMALVQGAVVEEWGKPQKWSRESMAIMAARRCGFELSPEVAVRSVEAFWTELGNRVEMFGDVPGAMRAIREARLNVRIITGSDARLLEKDGKLHYDPEASRRAKERRIRRAMEMLSEYIPIPSDHVIICDPHDKPDPYWFTRVCNDWKALGADCFEAPDDSIAVGDSSPAPGGPEQIPRRLFMVGDSFASDLVPAHEAGFDMLFHLRRDGDWPGTAPSFGVERITSLGELIERIGARQGSLPD